MPLKTGLTVVRELIDWIKTKKKYENIPDMRDVEGGRGIGFYRNVG